MRLVKFRVWDKDYKKMHICGEDVHDSITFDSDGIAFYYNLQNGDGSYDDDSSYVLMQWTGLMDRNGVEGYEGDIVKLEGENGDTWVLSIEPYGTSLVRMIDGELERYDCGDYYFGHEFDFAQAEIIGNIHSTPELLEVK